MKLFNTIFTLLLILSTPSMASEAVKLCSKGKDLSLPKAYQGKFASSVGGAHVFTKNQYILEGLGYFNLSSCIIQGFRVITLTDSANPGSAINFTVTLNEQNDLVAISLENMEKNGDLPTFLTGENITVSIYVRLAADESK